MSYRLPDGTMERALVAALHDLRGGYRSKLNANVLVVERGFRLGGFLMTIVGVVIAVALFWAFSIMYCATIDRLMPTWSLVLGLVVLALGVLGAVMTARAAGVPVHRIERSVRGFGGAGGLVRRLGAGARVRLSRSLIDNETGSGSIELVNGDDAWPVLDVEGVRYRQLAKLKVLTIALGAWLEIDCEEKTDDAVARSFESVDTRVGLVRGRRAEVSAVDVVVGAIELLQALD